MKRVIAILMWLSLGSAMAQTNRVALVQSSIVWGDFDANIAAFDCKISLVEDCDLIIMPELFTSGCDMQSRAKHIKDSVKHEIASRYPIVVERMKLWAERSGAVVIGSTIYEQDSLFFNRLLAVYPTGDYFYYDKHNCFKRGSFSPGQDHLVIDVNGCRYATYICYDLRFSDWSYNAGRYDAAIYIANWPESRRDDWKQLLSERARENCATVFGVNCVGVEPSGVGFVGESGIYLPNGLPLDECQESQEHTLIIEHSF